LVSPTLTHVISEPILEQHVSERMERRIELPEPHPLAETLSTYPYNDLVKIGRQGAVSNRRAPISGAQSCGLGQKLWLTEQSTDENTCTLIFDRIDVVLGVE